MHRSVAEEEILLGLCQFWSIADAAEAVMSQNSDAFIRIFCCCWLFGWLLDLDSFASLDSVPALRSIINTLI